MHLCPLGGIKRIQGGCSVFLLSVKNWGHIDGLITETLGDICKRALFSAHSKIDELYKIIKSDPITP